VCRQAGGRSHGGDQCLAAGLLCVHRLLQHEDGGGLRRALLRANRRPT
jgi:hypothetical protein